MSMFKIKERNEKGFTLIELLVVAAIIGILLALAIPNLLKARISANEANARKMMQTLRDAEAEFFEQDLDGNGQRDFVTQIGDNNTTPSLRMPGTVFDEQDALIDNTFEGALVAGSDGANSSGVASAECDSAKAGYCLIGGDISEYTCTNNDLLCDDLAWEVSMTSVNKTGRRDFYVGGDGVTRCIVAAGTTFDPDGDPDTDNSVDLETGDTGQFQATRQSGGCS